MSAWQQFVAFGIASFAAGVLYAISKTLEQIRDLLKRIVDRRE